jgi:1,4-alpha-glucan branching enzyme
MQAASELKPFAVRDPGPIGGLMTASTAGMGALLFAGGASFRVWAPFATNVCVAGSFNGWSMTANSLTHEENGYWSTDVSGAKLDDQYKFVLTSPFSNKPIWKNDPYARAMTNSVGNSIIAETDYVWATAGFSTPRWNELVIYELHVATFQFDPGNRNGRGTFDTVARNLDYLVELGVNAIQLLPADEFPTDISWGYNPAAIFAIEESYGGPNGLRRLVDAAQARGLSVIFDVVYNHLGPDDLDLWQFDGWNQNGLGGIYFYNDWRTATPWGPPPDYARGAGRQFLREWRALARAAPLRLVCGRAIGNPCRQCLPHHDPGSDIPDGWARHG